MVSYAAVYSARDRHLHYGIDCRFILDTVTFESTDVSVKPRPSATCFALVTLDWIMAAGMFADCKIGPQTKQHHDNHWLTFCRCLREWSPASACYPKILGRT